MPDTVSAVLSLPFIQPNQAQKHVTHNTALRVLDGIIQLAVIARDLDSPPVAEVGALSRRCRAGWPLSPARAWRLSMTRCWAGTR